MKRQLDQLSSDASSSSSGSSAKSRGDEKQLVDSDGSVAEPGDKRVKVSAVPKDLSAATAKLLAAAGPTTARFTLQDLVGKFRVRVWTSAADLLDTKSARQLAWLDAVAADQLGKCGVQWFVGKKSLQLLKLRLHSSGMRRLNSSFDIQLSWKQTESLFFSFLYILMYRSRVLW